VRSADSRSIRLVGALAAGLAAVALAGCVSTQTKNARTLLVNARTLDAESRVRVTTPDPDVTVSGVQLVRSALGDAVVVTVRNDAAHPVSDLPISVGLRVRGQKPSYLNGAANLPYFATHVTAIEPSATATWVLTIRHTPTALHRAGSHLFAVVGEAQRPASTRARSLPRLEARLATAATGASGASASASASAPAPASGRLVVTVANGSGVPQIGLPVYAVATRAGHVVGAASGSVGELDGGSRARLSLKLFGTTTGATVQLSALPTIFN